MGHSSALVSHRITDFPTNLGMAVMNAGLIISPNIGGFLGLLESFNFLLYQFFFFFSFFLFVFIGVYWGVEIW